MATRNSKLSSFSVIGFDTMGTLLDEKKGIETASEGVRQKLPSGVTYEKFFDEFETHLKDEISAHPPPTTYHTILATAFGGTVKSESGGEYKVTSAECSEFAESLAYWPAFEDTIESLQYLAQKHKLVALTNMDQRTIEKVVNECALKDVPFAAIQGGDKTGAFKPDHRVNQALLDIAHNEFGVGKEKVLLVAQGLASDHAPAKEMGISSGWIDRYGAGEDAAKEASPIWIFSSMKELVDEMKRQL